MVGGSSPSSRASYKQKIMNKFTLYLREAYDELLHKVSWPSWKELQASAGIVLIASLIIAMVVLVIDQSSRFLLQQIYKLLW